MYDVVVIGAGIVGSNVAYNLGKYRLKVLVMEKESDVATKTSKANSGIIHSGYDNKPNTLKAKMNLIGTQLYPKLAEELNFPYQKIGSLVLAFTNEQVKQLTILLDQGIKNKVTDLSIIDKQKVLELEPNINTNVKKALYAPNTAIICPYEATLAFAENAVLNNVQFQFDDAVVTIIKEDDHFLINNKIKCRYIINAAGVYSDDIAKLVNDDRFQITPRKGEYLLFDRLDHLFNHVIFQTPTKMGKGILITPTVNGNTMIGPTAVDQTDKDDDAVTQLGIDMIKNSMSNISNKIETDKIITSFSGLRAIFKDDFVIETSNKDNHFINLIGISSPGLASAPAIGEYVIDLLKENGLNLQPKANFMPYREKPIRITELSNDQYQKLIRSNPLYGKIVCRCEVVSEQEIINAINRPIRAITLDGIKRRTRAMMGRCQGGFCSTRIMELINKHANIPMIKIKKSGKDSMILYKQIKEDESHDQK
ncbi:MAG: NAD(P)/FAD-dependent oxidoreductase [Erysipelotrichaceae bacterium]|nr:NAD(P)/FAD-dependent oxidoreductase [Erysipelotrichaceae bacterium]